MADENFSPPPLIWYQRADRWIAGGLSYRHCGKATAKFG